jgi:hypothetical protein
MSLDEGYEHISFPLPNSAVLRAIAASGALPRLVALLSRSSEQRIVCPALRVTGNFIAGDVAATQAALDVGALRLLVPLLAHSSRRLQKEALWTLSNVAAGSPEQMAALVREPGLLAGVVRQLQGGEWTIKKEARCECAQAKCECAFRQNACPCPLSLAGRVARRKHCESRRTSRGHVRRARAALS